MKLTQQTENKQKSGLTPNQMSIYQIVSIFIAMCFGDQPGNKTKK